MISYAALFSLGFSTVVGVKFPMYRNLVDSAPTRAGRIMRSVITSIIYTIGTVGCHFIQYPDQLAGATLLMGVFAFASYAGNILFQSDH